MRRFVYISADRGIPVPGDKGSSHHVTNVCRALGRFGFQGDLYTARPTSAETAGVAVRSLSELDAAPRRVEFVYERYSLWHLDGLDWSRRHGTPFILEVNSPLPDEARRFRTLPDEELALHVARRLMREADGVVCVSKSVSDWVTDLRGHSGGVWTIPNGVDETVFRAATQPLAIPFTCKAGPVLGFTGSFRPWHGLDGLLVAASRSPLRPRVLCVGDGPGREAFERRATQLGMNDRVFVTGFVPHDEVPRWLAACDVAVAPYEPSPDFYFSPLKVFEFMALGLPLIAADVGQLRETVGDATRGLLYPAGDADGLVAAIERVVADPRAARLRAEKARRWVLEHATWTRRVQAILRHIAEAKAVHG